MEEAVLELLNNNIDLSYRRLSLNCINRYSKVWYQVDCDDYRMKPVDGQRYYSRLFKDPVEAVRKFTELKRLMK
jgi:hypothetical protein